METILLRFCRRCSIYYLLASVKSAIVWLQSFLSTLLLPSRRPTSSLKSDILKRHHVPWCLLFSLCYWILTELFQSKTQYLCSGKILVLFFISLSLLFTLFLSFSSPVTHIGLLRQSSIFSSMSQSPALYSLLEISWILSSMHSLDLIFNLVNNFWNTFFFPVPLLF